MQHTFLNKFAFGSLLAIIVLTTLLFGAVDPNVLALTYALIVLAFLLWAVDALRSTSIRVGWNALQIPLLGAAIYGFFQVIPYGSYPELGGVSEVPKTISLDPFATLLSALHFVALLLFFSLMLTLLNSASRLRTAAGAISVFGFLFAFFAILQAVLSPGVIYGYYGNVGASPFGSFVSRNNFAAWMELAAAIPLGLLFTGAIANDKRLLYVTAAGLMGVSIIASGSRGGSVAFVVEIVFLLLLTVRTHSGKNTLVRFALAAGLLIAVVAGSIFVGGESALTRIAEGQNNVSSSRAHIWSVTLNVIADSMPLGVGLGGFGVAYTKFDTAGGFERVEQAHNDYLQVVSDAGIVGAILGVAFLFFLVRIGGRSVRTENVYRRGLACGAFAGILGALVHSIFDFGLHTAAIALLLLMLLAILVACSSKYDDDRALPVGHKGRR